MANPSTGFGGVGTEVLRRSYIDGASETEATILTGVNNHIMTIISIIINDVSGESDNKFQLYIDYDLGGTNLMLTEQKPGAVGTFVWNDKFILTNTDKLHIKGFSTSGTALYDVWCTYIDQQLA
tara:strand:- start:1100 stop:1471 length:372 start_codon:yes stop_codon:yes gene_type:complete